MDDPRMPKSEVEWNEFYDVINKGGKIAVFTVSSAILDSLLKRILIYFSVDDKNGEIIVDKQDSPINKFNGRIKCAYAFGLIDENEYNNIEIIRQVRNEYVHRYATKKFNTKKVEKLLNKIRVSDEPIRALSNYDKCRSYLPEITSKLMLRTSLIERCMTLNKRVEEMRIPKREKSGEHNQNK